MNSVNKFKGITKGELIKKLQELDVPDDTEIVRDEMDPEAESWWYYTFDSIRVVEGITDNDDAYASNNKDRRPLILLY